MSAVLPSRPASLDEAAIERLVHGFYGRVREDAVLAPVFDRRIAAESWPLHLRRMCSFWQSVLLRTGDYDGRPLPPHLALPELSDEHFQRWLALFRRIASEVMDEPAAAATVAMAERIAQSFRMALAFHRAQDMRGLPPLAAAV